MNKENETEEVLQGEPVTDTDNFYFDWVNESIKENVKLANDILRQIITLSTALLGVSIIFEKIVMHETLRLFVIVFFFGGLIISFFGVLPYQKTIDTLSPSDIKKFQSDALKHKLKYVWIASICIVLGFAIIIAELIYQVLN